MKRILVVVLLAGLSYAQQPAPAPAPQVVRTNIVEHAQAPTYSDSYCAGFISDMPVPREHYVGGGWETPHATKFADRDYVYLTGGGYQEGTRFTILRALQDPNVQEYVQGQKSLISGLGQPYAEMGRVRIVGVNGDIGIAQVEFACDGIATGDLAVPFAAKEIPTLRLGVKFDRFAPPNGKTTGRIVMVKDFDTIIGTGQKVYLNVGSSQGIKVGDYFRAVRSYPELRKDSVDSLSFKATNYEDNQKNPPTFPLGRLGELPRRSLGEMIVLTVTPKSSTAMVTFALESILIGDSVELEEVPPPPPPPPPAPMNPPTISCAANPATIRVGESSNVSCDAASPDNRPVQVNFASNGGTMTQRDSTGTLTSAEPGTISVKATATDDRNLSSVALTTVNVEAPPAAPTASRANEIAFKTSSAYVDNRAKAVLDDIALRLQQDPNSSVMLVGFADPKEARAKTLAQRRADNAATYLTKSKGIDPGRVHTKAGAEPGKKDDIWMVPAGAQMP